MGTLARNRLPSNFEAAPQSYLKINYFEKFREILFINTGNVRATALCNKVSLTDVSSRFFWNLWEQLFCWTLLVTIAVDLDQSRKISGAKTVYYLPYIGLSLPVMLTCILFILVWCYRAVLKYCSCVISLSNRKGWRKRFVLTGSKYC